MALDSDQRGSSKVVSGIIMAIFAGVIVVAILVFRSPRGSEAAFKTASSKIEPGPGPETAVPKQPSLPGIQVGSKAPEIEGEDIQGTKFKLTDYRGKVIMLDFWGHW